ncbi:MAG: hypothetical protein ACK4GT_20290, partial [Pararhodobacter sp.]
LLLGSAALPAAAQYDDSANINAAFQAGKASGVTPQTTRETWSCAAFWFVWSEFVEDEFGEAMRAKLDPALAKPAALEAASHWESAATAHLGMAELDPETRTFVDQQVALAWMMGEGIAMGEDYDFADILGSCAVSVSE